ncbi:MAG: hypothetical protein NVS4B11_35410 [Ktedonobacteraceae bacterium]
MKNETSVGTFPTHSLYILSAMLLLIAALWSSMTFTASTTQQTLDQHVQHIGAQLKCPICQGESVADSPSGLAQQMRGIIRQKIQAGQSDQQIIQFFSDRYGEQIVWAPQWWGFSLFTWLVPIALLLGGLVLIFFTLRDWRTSASRVTTHTAKKISSTGSSVSEEDAVLADSDAAELARYRVQLERELAAEDALFERPVYNGRPTEAH